ncbi:MAG: calcium-binding protein [Candidatus Omnitrophota bacterium]
MALLNNYDSSWDEENDDLLDQKFEEWEKRNWARWLSQHLAFPFDVKREEDSDETFFTDIAKKEPFRLGHVMTVLSIEEDDPDYGIIIKVREGKKEGLVPLADMEVVSRTNPNFWPVREYVVWFANR